MNQSVSSTSFEVYAERDFNAFDLAWLITLLEKKRRDFMENWLLSTLYYEL